MTTAGVLDWWLWPIIVNLLKKALGPERGLKIANGLLWFMAELARMVEGNPDEPDGAGPHKKLAVRENVISLLREIGVWSDYWLHEAFWRWIIDLTIDRVVALLKAKNWENPFAGPDSDLQGAMIQALGCRGEPKTQEA